VTLRWKRRLTVLGLAFASLLGMLFAASPAYADAKGCNGEMCLELWGSSGPHPIRARITYTGGNPVAKNFGLITQHNGGFWSPPISGANGASFTWDNMWITPGQVCATIRWAGMVHGPPGYPCLQLR
jgi:hypothetical protein